MLLQSGADRLIVNRKGERPLACVFGDPKVPRDHAVATDPLLQSTDVYRQGSGMVAFL